jgi:uncharacterized protein DUF2760
MAELGFGTRISCAFRSFISIVIRGEISTEVLRELGISPASSSKPAMAAPAQRARVAENASAEPCDRAVQMLALLQRDGRLIDFLSEDVSQYPDVQLGAAVRMIHDSCRQVLDRYLKLQPVIASQEDQPVTVPAGFDPASIKLIGNVTGTPPMTGLLRHRGWRILEVNLPALPEGAGRSIVAPAEVEIS